MVMRMNILLLSLDCFQCLAIVNKSVMNILINVLLISIHLYWAFTPRQKYGVIIFRIYSHLYICLASVYTFK